jgi:hypothetical protein
MTTPDPKLLNRLYASLDRGGNVNAGGLAIDRGTFMARYWTPTPMPGDKSVFFECRWP